MLSQALRDARRYEEEMERRILPEDRPAFHLSARVGWMNDPNGFSRFGGKYHMFYQYHPFDSHWGPMHWGHAVSEDLLHWEYLPAAMAPDMPYDRDGCFSGGALELADGRQMLMYTGVRRDGEGREWQTQCLALGDGTDYERYAANPVLDGCAVPPGGSATDFRDPKVWREGDRYYAVAGNRTADGSGSILLFESEDALHWRYASTLDRSRNEYGKMWECPDFFQLDGKRVLLTSPQEMRADAAGEFHDGYGTLCLIGELDGDRHLVRERAQAIDYGLDFYAPQTLETPDGRRVMIAWMQDWDTSSYVPEGFAWHGMMTFPRELRLREGRLYQTPVGELEAYRGPAVVHTGVSLSGERTLPGVEGRHCDLIVTVRPGALCREFSLRLASGVCLRWKPEAGTLDMEREGFPPEMLSRRSFAVAPRNGALKLRVLLDDWSAEVFVNDGAQAATCVFYTDPGRGDILFSAQGQAEADVEFYPLRVEG